MEDMIVSKNMNTKTIKKRRYVIKNGKYVKHTFMLQNSK